MATVVVQAVASLDGYIARPDDLPGPIFDWYQAGAVELTFNPDHVFKVSQQSADCCDRWNTWSGLNLGSTSPDSYQSKIGPGRSSGRAMKPSSEATAWTTTVAMVGSFGVFN